MNIGPRGEGEVFDCLDCARGSVDGDCQSEGLSGEEEQDFNEGTSEEVEGGLASEVW